MKVPVVPALHNVSLQGQRQSVQGFDQVFHDQTMPRYSFGVNGGISPAGGGTAGVWCAVIMSA